MTARRTTRQAVKLISDLLDSPALVRLALIGDRLKKKPDPNHDAATVKATPFRIRQLPDFRPADMHEARALLMGKPHPSSQWTAFDPALGPFADPGYKPQTWMESFEFLRDLRLTTQNLGPDEDLAPRAHRAIIVWTADWLARESKRDIGFGPLALLNKEAPKVTGRRVLNWLAHLLPVLKHAPDLVQAAALRRLQDDVRNLVATQESQILALVLGPAGRSLHGRWLQACAIIGAHCAIANLVLKESVVTAVQDIEQIIQADGTYADGDPVHTLAAGADLCMLAYSQEVQPVLARIRRALASLRDGAGDLVDFSTGQRHAALLQSVLGPDVPAPVSILSQAEVGRLEAGPVTLWVKTRSRFAHMGPALHLDLFGKPLLRASTLHQGTALFIKPSLKLEVESSKIRRRDEADQSIIEASTQFKLGPAWESHKLTCMRAIRLKNSGRKVHVEDALFGHGASSSLAFDCINLILAKGTQASLARDKGSVLIVTVDGHGLRLRPEGLDIEIKTSFEQPTSSERLQSVVITLVPRADLSAQRDLVLRWHLEVEEFV